MATIYSKDREVEGNFDVSEIDDGSVVVFDDGTPYEVEGNSLKTIN